jgi:hypothetical protein
MIRVFGCWSRTKGPPALTVRILSTAFCISPTLDRITLHNISPSPACFDMYWLCHACSPNMLSIARHSYSLYWEDTFQKNVSSQYRLTAQCKHQYRIRNIKWNWPGVLIRVILRPCYLHWLALSYTVIRSVHGQLYTTLSSSAAHKRAVE